ncbi:MAG: hypothetical protein AUK55_11420 [Syntrophobacteraceae bacterium CG2_30_61_12]|nr:MAG: hypothetical protein AUK55_11420 [Syntrophobacteraceae bacterium CG2_30_61_12]
MISVDVTLFIQIGNFLLLVFLMNIVLYRPIRRLVGERNQFVSEQREDIEQADAEANNAVRTFEDSIKAARLRGRQKVQEMKDAAYIAEKDLLERAHQGAGQEVQAVKEKIQQDMGTVRDQLKQQVQAFSKDLAQRVLGRSL